MIWNSGIDGFVLKGRRYSAAQMNVDIEDGVEGQCEWPCLRSTFDCQFVSNVRVPLRVVVECDA
jgi:hypothetical protein